MLVCQEFGKINSPRSAIVNIELQHNEVILEEIHGWDLSDVSALVHGTNVDNVRNTHHCYVFRSQVITSFSSRVQRGHLLE